MRAKPIPNNAPPMACAQFGGMNMEIRLGKMMQGENSYHANNNCRKHDLDDGEILKQELADQHIVFADAHLSVTGIQKRLQREPRSIIFCPWFQPEAVHWILLLLFRDRS